VYFADNTVWDNIIAVVPLPENLSEGIECVKIYNHIEPLRNVGSMINKFSKQVLIDECIRAKDLIGSGWQRIFDNFNPVQTYDQFVLISFQKIDLTALKYIEEKKR
jgi:hypothetical protein